MVPFYLFLGMVLISFSIGIMLGHAAGYGRRGDVERRRAARAMASGPKYQRVGAPE